MQMNRYLPSTEATEAFALEMAEVLISPMVIGLSGEIGMGKTSLVRAMLKALGVQSAIKSPTFNLVETYDTTLGKIHHFDLYRISSMDDLEYLGFRDYLQASQICLIEWPEQAPALAGFLDIRIEFQMPKMQEGREIIVKASSKIGENFIAKWVGK